MECACDVLNNCTEEDLQPTEEAESEDVVFGTGVVADESLEFREHPLKITVGFCFGDCVIVTGDEFGVD